MREFLVLRQHEAQDGVWDELARCQASAALHAIEKTADRPGVYIAVPDGAIREVEPITKFAVIEARSRNGSK